MVKKVLYIALIVSLVFGVGLFSGCRPHGHHKGAEFMVDYVTEVLDLNEAQQEQLNQIKVELMGKVNQMRANKAKFHDEIMAQLSSEEIDQARVKSMVAEHRAQMDEVIDLMIVQFSDFHRTLTPEQRTKLVNKVEDFHKWHHNGLE
ncbi:MAG: periplasmic heavy metal sensor [Desulfobacterales bacterium]|nr:MAG: periplasmic heavy metal sensor [Desulfobacterales bacterium]